MEDYGSMPGGESVYKDSKGYYIIQWNPKINKEYRKYLPKSWKPDSNRTRIVLQCKSKSKRCKWATLKSKNKHKNKTKRKK